MFYRIASLTLFSQMILPSFAPFVCEETTADVRLERTDEKPPEGEDRTSGNISHRKIPDGWFFHSPEESTTGLIVSDDYTSLRLTGQKHDFVSMGEEWFIRVALECRLILMGYVSVHAAAVTLDGGAYVFSGPSGTGKSTRAKAWCDALGAELISGDRPLLHVESLELYGVPWDGKEHCHKNVHFPLRAFLEIRRSSLNYLRKMSFDQCRKFLIRQCFLPIWDTDTAAVQMRNILYLARKTPVVRAFCGPAGEDAGEILKKVGENAFKEETNDMKAKSGFVLRKIADEYMLMPVNDNIGKFNGAVVLNEVSSFIWEKLQNPVSCEDLLEYIVEEYDVDKVTAKNDLDSLLDTLQEMDVIDLR